MVAWANAGRATAGSAATATVTRAGRTGSASGGLDEHAIAALVASRAPIDAYGVGTKMGVCADTPYLAAPTSSWPTAAVRS